MRKSLDGLKACNRCKERLPLEAFASRHMHWCKECWTIIHGTKKVPEHVLANKSTPVKAPDPQYQAMLAHVNATANQPPDTPLHATRQGRSKAQRDMRRLEAARLAAAREHERQSLGLPVPLAPDPNKFKFCLHCKIHKPRFQFPTPSARICTQCDGPPTPRRSAKPGSGGV